MPTTSNSRAGRRPWLSGLALVAAMMLGVNLAWNVYRVNPAHAGEPAIRVAATPAPGEPEKIERLIAHVASLDGTVFIRNREEHGPVDAAAHLRIKLEKAGKRVRSADDFIRLCASHSYLSGEAYLIRFADGRTRTAEDVLREELARMVAASGR